MIRLQKALADRGVASRRHAEELIVGGRVRVDGVAVTTLGSKVAPDARIDVDGVPTSPATATRYVLLNKPPGIVSTAHDERGRRTVVELVGARERLYPVGRLDTDSEGMLLLTNDGDWAQRVIHPRFGHEREYDVTVSGEVTPQVVAQLQNGVRLEEGIARASRVEVRSRSRRESHLRVVLHTGWRRQIRRMLTAVGLRTVRLTRVRIGALALGRLRSGEWRDLSASEVAALSKPVERPAAPEARRDPRAPRPAIRPAPRAGGRPGTSVERVRTSRAPARPPVRPRDASRGAERLRSSAAPRAPARGGSPSRPSDGVPRVERVSAQRSSPRVAAPASVAKGVRRAGAAPGRRRILGRRPAPYGTKRGPVRAKVTPR